MVFIRENVDTSVSRYPMQVVNGVYHSCANVDAVYPCISNFAVLWRIFDVKSVLSPC